jgi:hypothetical protein
MGDRSPLATTTVVVTELLGPISKEDNQLFLLLFLRFGDGGPTVGNSRHKQLDRRGPALLLLPLSLKGSRSQREARDVVTLL